MKASTTSIKFNPGKLIEYTVTVTTITFDGREHHFSNLQFTRPELNTAHGRDDYDCGIHERKEFAVRTARVEARKIIKLVKAARKLPRTWAKINGKRTRINAKGV